MNGVIYTADNHLHPLVWSKHPELHGDSYYSFTQIVDLAIERRLAIIIAGDLFEAARPPAESVLFFQREVQRAQAAGVDVLGLRGNHDNTDPPWFEIADVERLDKGDGAVGYHLSPGDIFINGFDFQQPDALKERLQRVPGDTSVLVFHQSWLEIQRIGHCDVAFADVPLCNYSSPPAIVTGDYHIHAIYNGTARDGQPMRAYSCGSTCMQRLNESPAKHVWIMTVDGDGEPRFESFQLKTRAYVGIECVEEAAFAQALDVVRNGPTIDETLPPEIRKPILHFTYWSGLDNAYHRIHEAAGDRYHLFCEPAKLSTSKPSAQTVDAQHAQARHGMVEALGEELDARTPAYAGAVRLWNCQDPKVEIEQMRQEFLTS